MATETENTVGFHIRVRHVPWQAIVIHGPTENWQHRPGNSEPKDGYWVGPMVSKSRVEQVALDLADKHGYPIEPCKKCFPDWRPAPPTWGDAPAGVELRRKRRREYLPAGMVRGKKLRRGI